MPAKDRYHDAVKRALIRDGCKILSEQYFVGTDTRQFWVDLFVESAAGDQRMLVEGKSFLPGESEIENLANAIGKYLIYEVAIALGGLQLPLYLAVPLPTFQGILQAPFVEDLRRKIHIRLIVADTVSEVIHQWIP